MFWLQIRPARFDERKQSVWGGVVVQVVQVVQAGGGGCTQLQLHWVGRQANRASRPNGSEMVESVAPLVAKAARKKSPGQLQAERTHLGPMDSQQLSLP